jgi:DNA-binding XRE family transcriptional regulator
MDRETMTDAGRRSLNAEHQARWRAKRNALAKSALETAGAIAALQARVDAIQKELQAEIAQLRVDVCALRNAAADAPAVSASADMLEKSPLRNEEVCALRNDKQHAAAQKNDGALVKRWRKDHGLTQPALGEMLGVSGGRISQIGTDRIPAGGELAAKIAELLATS